MTLEEILQELGSKKPFLKEVEVDCYGNKQPFTNSGSVAYKKLIDILYAVEELTDTSMENAIEILDDIANE